MGRRVCVARKYREGTNNKRGRFSGPAWERTMTHEQNSVVGLQHLRSCLDNEDLFTSIRIGLHHAVKDHPLVVLGGHHRLDPYVLGERSVGFIPAPGDGGLHVPTLNLHPSPPL